jgi:hypothetical protein
MDAQLTPEELASLRELAKGALAGPVPFEHKQRLSDLNLIHIMTSEAVLTEAGVRLIAENP